MSACYCRIVALDSRPCASCRAGFGTPMAPATVTADACGCGGADPRYPFPHRQGGTGCKFYSEHANGGALNAEQKGRS